MEVFSCSSNNPLGETYSAEGNIMNNLLSMKLELILFELLTVKQMRGNPANCAIKKTAISARVLELEQLAQKIKNQIGGAFK